MKADQKHGFKKTESGDATWVEGFRMHIPAKEAGLSLKYRKFMVQ